MPKDEPDRVNLYDPAVVPKQGIAFGSGYSRKRFLADMEYYLAANNNMAATTVSVGNSSPTMYMTCPKCNFHFYP